MIRIVFILILVSLTGYLHAQTFRGRVLDLITKEPVNGATIKSRSLTSTDASGNFSLYNVKAGDTIKIIHISYKTYIFTFNESHPGLGDGPAPEFSLQPNAFVLQEVLVRSSGSYKADSLRNRKEFASEFAYKAPGLMDIFVVKSPEESMARHVDVHRGNNTYSASSLVKVDVLKVVSLLSKKKAAPSKLQKALITDEENKYLANRFSEERVVQLTKLEGDSLRVFMDKYRPAKALARSMTEYQIIAYIRKKYTEFLAGKTIEKAP